MLQLQPGFIAALTDESTAQVEQCAADSAAIERAKRAASEMTSLGYLAGLAKSVLEEQGFVEIRGLPGSHAQSLFLGLGALVGNPYIDPAAGSAIILADVQPGEALMGNQLRRLPLHTDYSMMADPPRLTMSCCVRTDTVPGFGAVHVSDIESMCFGVRGDVRIERLSRLLFPFAARNAQDDVDVIERPILSWHGQGQSLVVRYHRSRIWQGFRYRGQNATEEQIAAMLDFERMAGEAVQVLHPEAGDITIIDNHRMLHGRERCSVEIDVEGRVVGRQMLFLFAY
jgi:hypothetical protein